MILLNFVAKIRFIFGNKCPRRVIIYFSDQNPTFNFQNTSIYYKRFKSWYKHIKIHKSKFFIMSFTKGFWVFITSLFFIASCKESEETTPSTCVILKSDDYLAFGMSYGFCGGNCAHIYKLTTTSLYADNIDRILDKPITYAVTPESVDKLAIAQELCALFPEDLKKEKEERMGCPDCHDQGTIYIELRQSGQTHKWYIDPDEPPAFNRPAYLDSFITKFKVVHEKLRG